MNAPFRNKESHNMTKTPYYQAWSAMIERCRSPNNKAWVNYGGQNKDFFEICCLRKSAENKVKPLCQ